MALPSPKQTAVNTVSAANVAATFGSGTSSGNLLIAIIGTTRSTSPIFPSSVTDNQSQTWTLVDSSAQQTSTVVFGALAIYYMANSVSGVTTVTANGVSSSVTASMIILEYPLTGATPLDKHVIAAGATASAASGSTASLSQANELQVAYFLSLAASGSATLTSPSPSNDFLSETNTGGSMIIGISDALLASTTAVSASATVTALNPVWVCGTSTWKIPSNNSLSGFLSLMGCGN